MTITPMTVFWIVLLTAALIGFGVLISRSMKSGKDPGVPISYQPDTHDEPPAGSDAERFHEDRHPAKTAEEQTDDWVEANRTRGA